MSTKGKNRPQKEQRKSKKGGVTKEKPPGGQPPDHLTHSQKFYERNKKIK
ncbi:MAG TPA: hypothetical protein VM531_04335 [Sphingomicrobium sp.]|jgi:hypothetical protein|nr:hypothetical protein [Sphingomicrobium sp.]